MTVLFLRPLVIFSIILLIYFSGEGNKCDLLLHIGVEKENQAMIDVTVSASLHRPWNNCTGSICVSHPRPSRLRSDVVEVKNYHGGKRWAPADCTWIPVLVFHSGAIYLRQSEMGKKEEEKSFLSHSSTSQTLIMRSMCINLTVEHKLTQRLRWFSHFFHPIN